MPTVFRQGGYRFFFFSNEGKEPVHVHVERGEALAKLWLTGHVAWTVGFRTGELTEISALVRAHHALVQESWNAHFGFASRAARRRRRRQ